MGLFAELDTKNVERTEDTVGSGFSVLDSNVYDAKIKTAYAGSSKGGALRVTLVCDINGREYSEDIYITSRDKKPYFVTKQNKKRFLPGYLIMDSVCKLTIGKGISDPKLESEEKVLNVYDPVEGKKKPTAVPVLVELAGKTVCLGILKELHNKTRQDESGAFVETSEARERNNINVVFHADTHKTLNEMEDGKDAVFYDKWLERNKFKVIDRRKVKNTEDSAPFGVDAPEKKTRSKLFTD